MNTTDCPECIAYSCNPLIREACASVALDSTKTAAEVMAECLADYHRSGHREDGQ